MSQHSLKLLPAFLLLFLGFRALSQETLVLNVPGLSDASKITLTHGGKPLDASGFVGFSGKTFVISVKGGATKIKLFIRSRDLVNPPATIDVQGNRDLTVTDGKLAGAQLTLTPPFAIQVQDQNGVPKKTFDKLNFTPPTPGATGTTGTPGDQTPGTPPSGSEYKAGSIFYDAVYMGNNGRPAIIRNILAYYAYNGVLPDSIDDKFVEAAFKDNPYLKDFVPRFTTQRAAGAETGSSIGSTLLSAAGGLDVTNIVDGLAKFLVKRVKQELTANFFAKFDSLLADPHFADLRTVFPATYQALTLVGDEIYNYQGYLQTLRESFEADLRALNTNLPTIIDNHRDFFDKPENFWISATLRSGCYVAGQLKDKSHPGDILKQYPTDYLDSLKPAWKGSIQTLQLLSLALTDTVTAPGAAYWIGGNQIKQLVGNDSALRYFLGLIYFKAKTFSTKADGTPDPIRYTDKVTLNMVLDTVDKNYQSTRTFITNLIQKTNRLDAVIRTARKSGADSLPIQQYYDYATATIDLLKQGSNITSIPVFRKLIGIDLAADMAPYFDVATSASNIMLDISKRNYGAAIVQATHIYDIIVASRGPVANTKVVTETAHSQTKTNTFINNTKESLFKYGSFMAAVVQAKSSDDVESAIEAFALPSGSSRIKRETPFNVALNAYPGLFLGHESIGGIKGGSFFNAFGVTAPIGVSISVGNQRFLWIGEKGKGHWSYSLFLSLIDIGAPAAFRFNDDTTAQVPTIKLKDIVSPGAFLSIGIPKSPLSVNFGAQMGPNLRKVYGLTDTQQSNDYANKTYWRFSASLVVDIPIINFYTKSK